MCTFTCEPLLNSCYLSGVEHEHFSWQCHNPAWTGVPKPSWIRMWGGLLRRWGYHAYLSGRRKLVYSNSDLHKWVYAIYHLVKYVKILISWNIVHDCGGLKNPENGRVSFDLTTFKSVATYACDSGFEISGPSSRTCNGSGLWSGSSTVCTEGIRMYVAWG